MRLAIVEGHLHLDVLRVELRSKDVLYHSEAVLAVLHSRADDHRRRDRLQPGGLGRALRAWLGLGLGLWLGLGLGLGLG